MTAGGRSNPCRGPAGKTQSCASRAEPVRTHRAHPLPRQGDRARVVGHGSPTLMRLLFAVTPKGTTHQPRGRRHRCGYRQRRRKGVGWLGSLKAHGVPWVAFGQTRQLGMNVLPPRVLFTDPLGPAWVLLLLSAQITPLISRLPIAEGQT